ncbi:roadblock/LC7 domain-containing protein [Actinomadura violacea]|uniref:Roadblock/LC7 domain-containing protein n=1 Tax=Actinomadura violacea TaxID=2819934 RepID=A0ABS3RZ06_9ACTN|nr:roadblock/LC7 domain-containing protein [Actinomadura violacea]MBO2461528.1 roadblock/LC7 domain-containing protein [Actinomadura violacea]
MTDDQNWILADLLRLPGVRHVLVATADGLVKHRSDGMDDAVSARLAAVCAGLNSLAEGIARDFSDTSDPGMRRSSMELPGAVLFTRRAAGGSHLAVVADPAALDPGLIAQQMSSLINKIGETNLATPARDTAGPSSATGYLGGRHAAASGAASAAGGGTGAGGGAAGGGVGAMGAP